MNSTDDTLVKVYLKNQLESDYICTLVPIIFYTEMSVLIDQQRRDEGFFFNFMNSLTIITASRLRYI